MLHTENVPVQTGVSRWSKYSVLFLDTSSCRAGKTQPYLIKFLLSLQQVTFKQCMISEKNTPVEILQFESVMK